MPCPGLSGGFLAKLARDVITGKVKENEVARAIDIRNIVTSLGPAYIKLGQALSIRPDLLSPAAMNELQKLCDKVRVPPAAISFIYPPPPPPTRVGRLSSITIILIIIIIIIIILFLLLLIIITITILLLIIIIIILFLLLLIITASAAHPSPLGPCAFLPESHHQARPHSICTVMVDQ